MRIANARPQIEEAEAALLAALDRHGFGEAAKFAVRLAVEEALVNAFRHGHAGLAKSVPVELLYHVTPASLTVAITDQGPGYDPAEIPDPTLEENLEKTSGRGLMLIRSFMTEVHHELGGRRLVMVLRKDATA